jgi:hypothetical protein
MLSLVEMEPASLLASVTGVAAPERNQPAKRLIVKKQFKGSQA